MKIGILGTGMVGRTLAEALAAKGHHVLLGSRDPRKALKHTDRDQTTLGEWVDRHENIELVSFGDAARAGELLINATAGQHSLDAITQAGLEHFAKKIVIDVANPLNSNGPSLSIVNESSLGEQIQELLPQSQVVKALNTITASLMVNPQSLADGDHELFIAGNDEEAKTTVAAYLHEWFGWRPEHIIDLGDITNARGSEMYLMLWIRLFMLRKNPVFNIKLVS